MRSLQLLGSTDEEKKSQSEFHSVTSNMTSALQDHEKNDLDPDHDHLTKSDLRSRSDPDLT